MTTTWIDKDLSKDLIDRILTNGASNHFIKTTILALFLEVRFGWARRLSPVPS